MPNIFHYDRYVLAVFLKFLIATQFLANLHQAILQLVVAGLGDEHCVIRNRNTGVLHLDAHALVQALNVHNGMRRREGRLRATMPGYGNIIENGLRSIEKQQVGVVRVT